MSNQPSTEPFNGEEAAVVFNLAQFIGWHVAVVNVLSDDNKDLALRLVREVESNVKTLMLGKGVKLGDHEVTLNNAAGKALSVYLGKSLDDIADTLEANLSNMEATNGTTN